MKLSVKQIGILAFLLLIIAPVIYFGELFQAPVEACKYTVEKGEYLADFGDSKLKDLISIRMFVDGDSAKVMVGVSGQDDKTDILAVKSYPKDSRFVVSGTGENKGAPLTFVRMADGDLVCENCKQFSLPENWVMLAEKRNNCK